jgi:hypothetical protein
MEADREEDEYSYPPEGRPVELAPLGIQVSPPSKRRVETKRLFATVLDDAAIARIRAKVRKGSKS